MNDTSPTEESIREQLRALDDRVSAAATEGDLDTIEEELEEVKDTVESADFSGTDDESPPDDITDAIEQLGENIEAKRGPYPEEIIDTIDTVATTIQSSEWTESGLNQVRQSVAGFLNRLAGVDTIYADDPPEEIAAALREAGDAIGSVGLDPDEDSEEINALLSLIEGVNTDLEEAEKWDDLSVREQLAGKGFYDIVEHRKDFPPELTAIKRYEEQGDAESILLAFEMLDSEFMQRHCMEALGRLGAEEAVEELIPLANRRNETAIEALGKIGSPDAVDALTRHIDSGGSLAITSLIALGEIGNSKAIDSIQEQLLEAESPEVRSAAARALGMIGDPQVTDTLVGVLDSEDKGNVRGSAAWALRQIQTSAALEQASRYTDDHAYLVEVEANKAADALY